MTPTPRSGAGMTANEIEKRNCKELLEIVAALADENTRATTDAVVERWFDDPEENARYGNPVGGYLGELEAYGYVRRVEHEDRDGDEEADEEGVVRGKPGDVWADPDPAAFDRDYVADDGATWPPDRGAGP